MLVKFYYPKNIGKSYYDEKNKIEKVIQNSAHSKDSKFDSLQFYKLKILKIHRKRYRC